MQFLFSEYDNQLRRQRAIAGTKEKLERGIWRLQPPMGYSIVKEDKIRKIVVNEIGKKLRKAFEWKAQGMKNDIRAAAGGKYGVSRKKNLYFSALKSKSGVKS